MNSNNLSNFESAPDVNASGEKGFFPWKRLASKRICYLALPLIVMATIVEFVILATGWKYQQTVCLPGGMGVTFFGIGPIGAVILAVECLKLPLAVWTASRSGWQKGVMVCFGLPLICVLTFQLVKDMAVYEMGVAMTPANVALEKAIAEDNKVLQLNGELGSIAGKKVDRTKKLAELAARKAKAKDDLEQQLKLNEESRRDAISLTDYQKQQLSEVEARQASIIKQSDADAAQLTKEISELRTRRDAASAHAGQWNAEDARIENAYKLAMADYANKRAAYEKEKAAYDGANFIKRKLMHEPVDPGVPPDREVNTVLKPTEIADIDAQIKAKEDELAAVNAKRRERVAQVETDARRLREQFDTRSSSRREDADHKREALLAASASLDSQYAAEEKQVDQEYASVAQKIDAIQAQIDEARKSAENFYTERENAIKKTQVYRIATTVEIVRALIMGQHPVTIKATAKERGDLYTDQISMVRIWVYPVLAFIVAFLPTLMVEIGFSTLFMPEEKRKAHRLGFFGRRLHWLYIRAGRQKILRAERMAQEASSQIAARDQAIAEAQATAEKAIAEKDLELQAARYAAADAAAKHEENLKRKENEWVGKLTEMADSLNRAIAEKDALRDFQKSEIERQISLRQNAWQDRLAQLTKELDDQRAAAEAERTTLLHEHHKKMMEVTESAKTQVIQARRQAADAELAAVENTARISADLKEATQARDIAEARLQQQSESFSTQLAQVKDEAAREADKVVRAEKQRFERQQADFAKSLREREENFEQRVKQREQELTLAFEARLNEEKTAVEESARRREMNLERLVETRAREVDARWTEEMQQREEAAQARLKQREQQLQTQAEVRFSEVQSQAAEELRRRESDWQRQLDAEVRAADARLRQELQQKEIAFHAKLKQREVELSAKTAAREAELQAQFAADLRSREQEWQRQADARVQAAEAAARASEARMTAELQQQEDGFAAKLRQRDQQWQSKLDAARAEVQAQSEQESRRRENEAAQSRAQAISEMETRVRKELQDTHEVFIAQAKHREHELLTKLNAKVEACEIAVRERDEARTRAAETARQSHDLKNKLMEVTSLLTGWKTTPGTGGNGNGSNGNGNGNGNTKHVSLATVGRGY